MKRNLTLLLSLLLSAWAFGQQLYVGTYNVRYENSGDSVAGNVWSKRCQVICDLINFEHPDIFGTQEVLHPQLENMKRHLDQYNYIGVGRDDGKEAGSMRPYSTTRARSLCSTMVTSGSRPRHTNQDWDGTQPA